MNRSNESSDSFDYRHGAAERRLALALNPTTPQERRAVAWLQGWEIEIMDTISTMIERGRVARQ